MAPRRRRERRLPLNSQHAHTLTLMNTRTQTLPYEHLRRTEHQHIWRFLKSPNVPRRRRERRLPLNA
jgi:hypothetical protein